MFTEAWGRIPTQAEWAEQVTYFELNECVPAVRSRVEYFYGSPHFTELYPENRGRQVLLLALFRGALNRELDQQGYETYMDTGFIFQPWSTTLNHFLYQNPVYINELNTLADTICHPTDREPPFYQGVPYGWNDDYAPIDIGACGPDENPWVYQGTSGDELQDLLYDAVAEGVDTVYLAQHVVVRLTNWLVIPSGVTLKTWEWEGDPPITPERYASMGRLVRASDFLLPMIQLSAGSTLQSVWVDGQNAQLGGRIDGTDNVRIADDGSRPDKVTQLIDNRLSDTLGGTNVLVLGRDAVPPHPCGEVNGVNGVLVANNLVTGYAHKHYGRVVAKWADGITVKCEYTTVENNQLVDISDVGVVVFRGHADPGGISQHSKVRNNVMLNAGNSAFGGFGTDPYCESGGPIYDFSDTEFTGNMMWTSQTAHLDTGLYLGTRAWIFINPSPCEHASGRGAIFSDNTTGSQLIRTNTPIMASGMFEASVTNNSLNVLVNQFINCPSAERSESRLSTSGIAPLEAI